MFPATLYLHLQLPYSLGQPGSAYHVPSNSSSASLTATFLRSIWLSISCPQQLYIRISNSYLPQVHLDKHIMSPATLYQNLQQLPSSGPSGSAYHVPSSNSSTESPTATINYPKKPGFNLYELRYCAYITYNSE